MQKFVHPYIKMMTLTEYLTQGFQKWSDILKKTQQQKIVLITIRLRI